MIPIFIITILTIIVFILAGRLYLNRKMPKYFLPDIDDIPADIVKKFKANGGTVRNIYEN